MKSALNFDESKVERRDSQHLRSSCVLFKCSLSSLFLQNGPRPRNSFVGPKKLREDGIDFNG